MFVNKYFYWKICWFCNTFHLLYRLYHNFMLWIERIQNAVNFSMPSFKWLFSFNELSFFNKVFFIITDKNHIVSQNHGTANKSFVQWKCCINLFYVTTFSNDLHVGVRKQWYDQIYEHSLKMIKFILLNHKNEYTCTVHVFVFMHIMRQHTTKVLKRHPPPPQKVFPPLLIY